MNKTIKDIALELKENNSAKFYELLPQLCFGMFIESIYGGEIVEKVKSDILSAINSPVNPNSLLLGTVIYKLGRRMYNNDKSRKETE